ncbi:MAG TPA: hypothetical protein PLB31_02935 [Fimbriimonadaceae bacterium]|nr:hypothetical protein [Armatimonadota bacterium]HCM72512.1 hypothetical protein [Armatimonadota bacterium]HRD31203.1 hypothetical protein [Fimbriimonadaceae bacterium]HRE94662.1 hypothetical protein [Fimbriimonadaceae bacterium]HRI73406.1 hypothetical protein [Fimbriimonadaceae bacterium]
MTEDIFEALSHSPRIVERMLRVFPTDRLDDKIPVADFSPRQAVAMLADAEQVILDRIRAAHNKPGTIMEWYDAESRKDEHHFDDKNVFHEAEVFESRRQMTLAYLRGLSHADFDKEIQFTGREAFTIGEYLSLVLAHDIEFIGHLSTFLATEVATVS